MNNWEHVAGLREALNEVAWYGQHLHEYCNREISVKLGGFKFPTNEDYEIALNYDREIIEPWKFHVPTGDNSRQIVIPSEWPHYLRELDKLLKSFHSAIDTANDTLDKLPRELIDDQNAAVDARKSCRIRAMIHAAGQWAYDAKPKPKWPDIHLTTMLSMVKNGFIPERPDLWTKLKPLHEMVNELYPLESHLRRSDNRHETTGETPVSPNSLTKNKAIFESPLPSPTMQRFAEIYATDMSRQKIDIARELAGNDESKAKSLVSQFNTLLNKGRIRFKLEN